MDNCEIKGRNFIFQIPGAWDGCSINDLLVSFDMPFGISTIMGIPSVKQHMMPDQLETFMRLCLKYCIEQIDGNPAGIPVINEIGSIGINGATSQILTKLTAQYILFFVEYWQAGNN